MTTQGRNPAFRDPHPDAASHSAFRVPHPTLAWAGWEVTILPSWQPLKLSGTAAKGDVIIGDSACAVFVIRWERVGGRPPADPRGWAETRLKQLGAAPQPDPPAAAAFTACAWARSLETEEGKATTHWFGYAAPARLLIGITVNGVLPHAVRETVVRDVLPTLRTSAGQGPCRWALYGVRFNVPGSFELRQRHLYLGDVALEFGRGRQERLLVRQVYPGDLALGRLAREAWLDRYPFHEHRRLRRRNASVTAWQDPARGSIDGVQRTGWKRLPAPLGACSPRHTCAIAAYDRELNRLLLAEHMSRHAADAELCSRMIAQMNVDG